MPEPLPPLILTPPGTYRHYKGGLYEVLGTVRHSETLEPMTLYRALQEPVHGGAIQTVNTLHSQGGLWVRPAAMFAETVLVDGVARPRFAKV